MRFLSAVMVVTVALSVFGAAQVKSSGGHSAGAAKSGPKSTAAPKTTGAGAANAQSKDLQRIERETTKGAGNGQPKKTHAPTVLKADKSNNNPTINFNGKGGGGGSGIGSRNGGSLKGRLKQKGQGQAH
ncbi:MAG: hypothetical protein WBV46_05370 [Terriglobales bacterium]